MQGWHNDDGLIHLKAGVSVFKMSYDPRGRLINLAEFTVRKNFPSSRSQCGVDWRTLLAQALRMPLRLYPINHNSLFHIPLSKHVKQADREGLAAQ